MQQIARYYRKGVGPIWAKHILGQEFTKISQKYLVDPVVSL